jgi:uncharacterized protein HemX
LLDAENELTPDRDQALASNEAKPLADGDPQAGASHKTRFGAWLGYATLLLVLILVGAGVFLLQELRSKQEGLGSGLDKGDKQMQELLHQISSLQNELAALHSQFATVQSQVTTEDSKFERAISEQSASFNQKLDVAKSELAQSIQHIQRQMNKTRGDLMVADAEYLLSIANQKLHLIGDVKAVLAAMEAADQRLHDSGDPGVFKVREVLAAEINQLKGIKPPDVVGISAKLLTLEAKVPEIPLFLPHSDRPKERHEQPEVSEPAAEKDGGGLLDSTLKDLKDLVTVRHTDRPVQAILLPEQVEALRQTLLLKLEMARIALLRGDDALYKSNMESAYNWLHEHFDHDAALTKGVAEEIQALQAMAIRVPFPDISQSLALLRNIEKLRLEAEKTEEGAASEGDAAKPEAGAQP